MKGDIKFSSYHYPQRRKFYVEFHVANKKK